MGFALRIYDSILNVYQPQELVNNYYFYVCTAKGGKPKLQDRDAVLIRRSWFRSEDKITVEKIANLEECDEYGLTEVADVLL